MFYSVASEDYRVAALAVNLLQALVRVTLLLTVDLQRSISWPVAGQEGRIRVYLRGHCCVQRLNCQNKSKGI